MEDLWHILEVSSAMTALEVPITRSLPLDGAQTTGLSLTPGVPTGASLAVSVWLGACSPISPSLRPAWQAAVQGMDFHLKEALSHRQVV